jgi:anthranilate phosphoribosyltransferase
MNEQVVRSALHTWMQGGHLSRHEAKETLRALTTPDLPEALVAGALVALAQAGIQAEEIQGMVDGMRSLAHRPELIVSRPTVDIVGTGGDHAHSFNLSTGAALLAAAAGASVIKHGNRAVSSQSGSADVLSALGLKLPMNEVAVKQCFDHCRFAFLFAPHYHPAMKVLAPIRKALGIRTVFNLLGPLTNPIAPSHYVMGAYSEDVAQLMAESLAGLGILRAFVVHSDNGWDEPTPAADFQLWDVKPGQIVRSRRSAIDFGLKKCSLDELKGGTADFNAKALRAVIDGVDRGAHRDALLMGAALALEVSGIESDSVLAVQRLSQIIDDGTASQWLSSLLHWSDQHD